MRRVVIDVLALPVMIVCFAAGVAIELARRWVHRCS